jgi:VCBS repeat protein
LRLGESVRRRTVKVAVKELEVSEVNQKAGENAMIFLGSKPAFALSVILSMAILVGQRAGTAEPNILPLKISPADTASIARTVTNFRCHISPVRRTDGNSQPIVRPYCDQPAALTAAPSPAPTDLNYNGGSVVTTAEDTFLLLNCAISCWGDPAGFLSNLYQSNFIHLTDQYVNTTANGRYTVNRNVAALTMTEPHTMSEADIQAAVISAIRSLFPNGGGGGYNQIYTLMLPSGQDTCIANGTQCYSPDNDATWTFCAYHTAMDTTDAKGNPIHVLYKVLPFADVSNGLHSCKTTGGPQGELADSANNELSHETFELITDPDPGSGWVRNSDGHEIGDICSFNIQNPTLLNGTAYAIQKEYSNVAHACTPSAPVRTSTHDFDAGSGATSDIAWRDTGGNVAAWLMNGAQVTQSAAIGAAPTTWSIVGQRDFNGDGKYDLLWRDTSGNVAMWFMNGTQISSSVGVGNISTVWSVAGTADFNGDGVGDILWRDTSGNVAIWLMNGAQVTQSSAVGNAPPTVWSIVGTGDFNGDGMSDILWHDTSGNVAIWFVNGTQVTQSAGVGNVPTAWSIVGTGDFNGDGMSDILWRDTSGNVAVWLMNGTQVLQSAVIGNAAPATWTIAATGDFNGDGKSDILWRDTSGNVAMWFLNGVQVSQSAGVGNLSTVWTSQGVNSE